MKHMYSEEELLEVASIENLVDSKGRNRFIGGNGNPENISGMNIITNKWGLNGYNLIFEITGSFNSAVDANKNICTFVIPQWISNKIKTEELQKEINELEQKNKVLKSELVLEMKKQNNKIKNKSNIPSKMYITIFLILMIIIFYHYKGIKKLF